MSTVPPEVAALEHELSQLFAAAADLMRGRAQEVHPELTTGTYKVLVTLVRSGPMHGATLAATMYVDKSVISRITRQLCEFGLVERQPDPSDGRAYFLAATPDAIDRVNRVRDKQRGQLHDFLAGWVKADIEQLTALLGRLNSATQ